MTPPVRVTLRSRIHEDRPRWDGPVDSADGSVAGYERWILRRRDAETASTCCTAMTVSFPLPPARDRRLSLGLAAQHTPHMSDVPARIEAIHIAKAVGAPMIALDRVRALAGVGLEDDRYALGSGHWSDDDRVDRDLTLVEAEVIEDLAATDGIVLEPGATRRNVTTRGIRLNELVGRRFRIGDVECEGTRLCEPCQYLDDSIGRPILKQLVHRAGLRAKILSSGDIAIGSEIRAMP
jgi:MOSC domain-containing protein YiiM